MHINKIDSTNFTYHSFSEIFSNDILIKIFLYVFKAASTYKRSNLNNYCLVSKKFKILFIKSYFYYLDNNFIKIPQAQSLLVKNDSLIERGIKLNNLLKLLGSSNFFLQMIIDMLSSSPKYTLSQLDFLLKCGINPQVLDQFGYSPLIAAINLVESEKETSWELVIQIARLLLKYGADANGSTKKSALLYVVRQSPCSESIKELQLELVSLLCKSGADPQRPFKSSYDTKPISPFDYAKKHYPAASEVMKKYLHKNLFCP